MNQRPEILVVDDEPVNLHLITAALKGDYDVFSAPEGYVALSILNDQKQDNNLGALRHVSKPVTGKILETTLRECANSLKFT